MTNRAELNAAMMEQVNGGEILISYIDGEKTYTVYKKGGYVLPRYTDNLEAEARALELGATTRYTLDKYDTFD